MIINYLLPPLFLLVDTITLGFFEHQTISLLLCFYAASLLQPSNTAALIWSLFLFSVYSFLIHGTFGLSLLYLLPLSLIFLHAQNLLERTSWLPSLFLVSTLLADQLVVRKFLLQINGFSPFTPAIIGANLVAILLFEKLLTRR